MNDPKIKKNEQNIIFLQK